MAKRKILNSRDKKNLLIIFCISLFILICILVALVIQNIYSVKQQGKLEEKMTAYDDSAFSLSIKREIESDILFFEELSQKDLSIELERDESLFWDKDEVERWWIDVDANEIDSFSKINHDLIWGMLKDAP